MDNILNDVHEFPQLGSYLSHLFLHGSLVLFDSFHGYLLLSSGVVKVGSQLDGESYWIEIQNNGEITWVYYEMHEYMINA